MQPLPKLARRTAILTGVLALATLALTSWRLDAASEPAPADAAVEETVPLHEQVEVIVPDTLRHSRGRTYYVSVSLKNVSDEQVSGPVWLVIEDTGIEGLSFQSSAEDDHAVELLAEDATLRPGRRTRSLNLLWESERALAAQDRREFELQYRLTRGGSRVEAAEELAEGRPTREDFERVMRIQDRWTPELMAKEGVYGTATGLDADGQPAVLVLVERLGIGDDIPDQIDGVPVEIRATGEIVAKFPPPPDKGPGNGNGNGGGGGGGGEEEPSVDPTERFDRPVPIGVSTGNEGECSSGTIGCRVIDAGGNVYALSNNHVYALSNGAVIGAVGDDTDSDSLLQPGRYDTNCATSTDDVIGELAQFEPMQFADNTTNTVDAAIALLTTVDVGGADEPSVGDSTPADGYGTPKAAHIDADELNDLLGTDVQKYGRTSGQTTGRIVALNATVNVNYGGGNVATFVNQIVVDGDKGGFLKSGDSGSLMVIRGGTDDRRPAGLLFAGSMGGKTAIANPIHEVLDAFGVTIDGE